MKPVAINEDFQCLHCGLNVPKASSGYRNHCPFCLYSQHVDDAIPGDRLSTCKGLMQPVGCSFHTQKSWQLISECIVCHKIHKNILAEDDNMEEVAKYVLRENAKQQPIRKRKRTI